MFKLDSATWIRFAVWMAIGRSLFYKICNSIPLHLRVLLGFVLYFGYGMWNSSEEYVARGKIPPGGTTPLPKTTINAVASAAVTASVGLVPDPTIPEKLPLKRTLAVTSLDDDDETYAAKVAENARQDKENDEHLAAFVLAIEKTHSAAQEVFDKARIDREQAAFAAAILNSHELSVKIFHQLKADKEAEQLEMQKQMAALSEQTMKLHESLEQIFANIPKNQPEVEQEEIVKAPLSPRPAGPMSAVMDELKTKTAIIDAAEDEPETNVSIPETVVVPPDDSPAESTTGTDSPGNKSNSSSKLMLDELKKAINLAVVKTDDEDEEVVNLSPSAIAQRRDSPVLAVDNDSGADATQ